MKLRLNFTSLLMVLFLAGCGSETAISDGKTDPVLEEYPVVFIERTTNTSIEENITDQVDFSARNPFKFNPGANLIFKNNAFPDSPKVNLTAKLFSELESDETNADARIDIRDISVSGDGQQFLVSIRAPQIEDVDEDEQPTWNI